MNKQKGLAPILIVLIIAAVAGAFYLGKTYNKPASTTPSQQSQPTPTTDASPVPNGTRETANWKTYIGSGINSGISFQYPSNWAQPEVQKYTTQLYVGYTNQEWFNRINNLNIGELFSDQRENRTKLAAGKVVSGEDYVIFKDEPSESFQGEIFNQAKAYVIKDQTIYQISINQPSNQDTEDFNKVLLTVTIK